MTSGKRSKQIRRSVKKQQKKIILDFVRATMDEKLRVRLNIAFKIIFRR